MYERSTRPLTDEEKAAIGILPDQIAARLDLQPPGATSRGIDKTYDYLFDPSKPRPEHVMSPPEQYEEAYREAVDLIRQINKLLATAYLTTDIDSLTLVCEASVVIGRCFETMRSTGSEAQVYVSNMLEKTYIALIRDKLGIDIINELNAD